MHKNAIERVQWYNTKMLMLSVFVHFVVCEPGTYGAGCKEKCRCANGASCDHIGGGCTCDEGWQGKHCDKPCPQGFFGMDCRGVCNCGNNGAECNHVTGECKCSAGWTGMDCSKTCPLGTFGEGCQHQCHCGNGGTCDPVSGACVCAAGWRGNHCEEGKLQGNNIVK